MRIGVDLMGGDSSPQVLFQAVHQACHQAYNEVDPTCHFDVFATKEEIGHLKQKDSYDYNRINFIEVADYVTSEDSPLSVVRHKKETSMAIGIRMIRDKMLDAFVSAGNTGALIAYTALTLPLLPNCESPALLAVLPTANGNVAVIDVGGSILCKAEQLVQFAYDGVAYQQCIAGITSPRVGLLNIGEESAKGPSELRKAYKILQEYSDHNNQQMVFVGNVEGREVFQGKVDVLVTGGFAGNIFLKTAEGASSFLLSHLQKAFEDAKALHADHGAYAQIKEVLQQLKQYSSYDEYPGAMICSVDGIVVKCHGYSSPRGMYNAIIGAIKLAKYDIINNMVTKKGLAYEQ